MSLVEARMAPCVRLIENDGAASDGLGGVSNRWTEGLRFYAALCHEGTDLRREADRDRGVDAFTVLTFRDVVLQFHEVFRRETDGAVFRVVSNGEDCATPASAALDLRAARAERWEVPA